MSSDQAQTSSGRAARVLIRAFAFAGGILGVGLYGLLRSVVLLGRELEWLQDEPHLGAAYWWLLGGVGLGLLSGWLLVRLRRRVT